MTNIFFITLLFMISTPSFADNDKNVPVHSPAKGQLSAKDKSAAKQKELFNAYSKSEFKDPYDGWFDVSGWLINNLYGFIPVPIIITEPAIGYGGGFSLLFVDPKGKKFSLTPDIYMLGGMYTENGTYAGVGGYRLNFKHDSIRWTGALGRVDANLEMNPILNFDSIDKHVPVYIDNNIASDFIIQRLDFRLFDSNFFVGGMYGYFKNKVKNNQDLG